MLPRLQPGVWVHFHDIFLPREYPPGWITQTLMFSNEQYLLHVRNLPGVPEPDALTT